MSQQQFTALPSKEVDEAYSSDSDSLLLSSHTIQPHRRKWSNFRNVFLLLASNIFTALLTLYIIKFKFNFYANSFCTKHTSQYSPILNEIDVSYKSISYNGSFFHKTVYREEASPEVDAAWEALGVNYRALAIPLDEALKSGLVQDQVHMREKYGGGYPVNVEGLHHLHCLNLMRQALPWNIEYYKEKGEGPFSNKEHILKAHVSKLLFCSTSRHII
jgi:hypothetical protein